MRAYPNNNNSGNSGNGSSGRTRSSVPSNWMGWKELGKRAYDAGDYEEALNCYKTAIQTEYECPAMDRQVLLSNMVACRLKLASSTSSVAAAAQAAAAVENAQQCIAINPSWSKGHVRLASAYIALGQANTNSSNRSSGTGNNTNGRLYSNDACNALQTALRLDPGNAVARQMLLRELRGRDHSSQAAPSAAAATAPPPPPPPQNPNYIPSSSSSPQERGGGGSTNNNNNNNSRNTNSPTFMNVDDTVDDDTDLNMSWRQRLQYHQARLVHWYQSQTEIKKSCIKAAVIFLVLYVAFGGRFGLMMESSSSSSSTSSSSSASRSRRQYSYYDEHHHPTTTTDTTATMTRGNYGSGNAYEEYRRRRAQQQGGSQYDEYEYDYYGDMHRQRQRQQQQQQHYGGSGNSYRSSWSLSSFSIANLFDGSLPSMAILLGIAYICHKYGINPFQVILMLNMIGGGRRHRGGMYYGGGGGGFGGGMRYGGGGGGRRRYW
jgi:tetratricopeptide (TPR) repeat protein